MKLLGVWIAAATVAAAGSILAEDVSFDELVGHPERFNGRRISAVGIAEDGGDRIYLYRDVEVRRRVDLARTFVAYIPRDFPNYRGTNMGHFAYANARWVRVTGVIDTRIHGRWGTERFGLRLERLSLLGRPRLMEFVCDLAVILNATPHEIAIEVVRNDGGTDFTMSAGETASEACISENGTVTAVVGNGKRITSRPLVAAKVRSYYNARRKEYYYRVTERSVTLVPPAEARDWKRYPTPERDPTARADAQIGRQLRSARLKPSNQAMQLTARKLTIYVPGVCHRTSALRASRSGLAAADLASR